MPSRTAFWSAAFVLAALVIVRAFPFVWWPGVHFDSDQAIVGLMAKHVSEARAFPLYFYGQNYMLAVEAYLAAPLMLAAGPTVTSLKAPLVLVNVLVVVLLLRVLVREARLSPWVAVLAVLPLAMPAAGVAARVTEANGGNVEPWLYVLLLWVTRARPWWFGIVLGIGMLHREFTAYGALALALMDALGVLAGPARMNSAAHAARRWTLVAIAFFATRGLAAVLRPYANGMGPGSRGDDPILLGIAVDTLGGRVCLDPATWPSRASALVGDHLPRLIGGVPAQMREYGVNTGVFSGQDGLGVWVAALTATGLASGAWQWWTSRRLAAGAGPAPPPTSHIGGYLVLVGLISTLVYGFATCSSIRVETLRYNLLGVLIPVGALVMALQAWRAPTVRAGIGAAVVLWCALNASDILALTRESVRAPFPDQRQALADELERRGVTVAWSAFRNAYHVTFLSRERVRVSANDFSRIKAYFDEAHLVGAPTIAESPCDGGERLQAGVYLCP